MGTPRGGQGPPRLKTSPLGSPPGPTASVPEGPSSPPRSPAGLPYPWCPPGAFTEFSVTSFHENSIKHNFFGWFLDARRTLCFTCAAIFGRWGGAGGSRAPPWDLGSLSGGPLGPRGDRSVRPGASQGGPWAPMGGPGASDGDWGRSPRKVGEGRERVGDTGGTPYMIYQPPSSSSYRPLSLK